MRNRIAHAIVGLAVVTSLLAGCSAPAVEHAIVDPQTASDLVPEHGAHLGMYYGDRSVAETNRAIGTVPAIHLTYVSWADGWTHEPVLADDAEREQTSLINWEPVDADFHKIIDGDYDDLIEAQGKGARDLTRPVLLDFAAEMNEAEGWGGHDPALYVAAYRHVHDLIAHYADDKIAWVWAPNNTDSDGAPPAIDYYPGDAYVDWTGIDGYNWGDLDPELTWQSFDEVLDRLATRSRP